MPRNQVKRPAQELLPGRLSDQDVRVGVGALLKEERPPGRPRQQDLRPGGDAQAFSGLGQLVWGRGIQVDPEQLTVAEMLGQLGQGREVLVWRVRVKEMNMRRHRKQDLPCPVIALRGLWLVSIRGEESPSPWGPQGAPVGP